MRLILLAAIIEASIVALWIMSFMLSGSLGTVHQNWYVSVPTIFLILPVLTSYATIRGRAIKGDRRIGFQASLIVLLLLNLGAFGFYGAVSGGGI